MPAPCYKINPILKTAEIANAGFLSMPAPHYKITLIQKTAEIAECGIFRYAQSHFFFLLNLAVILIAPNFHFGAALLMCRRIFSWCATLFFFGHCATFLALEKCVPYFFSAGYEIHVNN